MHHRKAILLAFTVFVTLLCAHSAAAISPEAAAAKALNWLRSQQNDDGGFGSGFGPGSGVGPTADAIIAITAGGEDTLAWVKDGQSPIDYLRAQVGAGRVTLPGDIAKTILALVATRQNPRAFGDRNLIADLGAKLDAGTGAYSPSLYDQALAILALGNAGEAVPASAVDALLRAQTVEGGWAFTGDILAGAADSNTTSMVVQALVASGRKDDTGRAMDYFRRVQNADAGWTYQVPSAFGTDTDANSTALGIQAILATGDSISNWAASGSDPLGALLSLQNEDGSFSFNRMFPGPNALATLQAVPALYGYTLVRVNVVGVPSSSANAPALLPVAGSAPDGTPALALGAMLIAAGVLSRRRVQVW